MPSKHLANPASASAQLLARTDGRTNERPTHHTEIQNVGEVVAKTTGIHNSFGERLLSADLDFADFMKTRRLWKVEAESPDRDKWPSSRLKTYLYEQETEDLLKQVSKLNGRKAA